MHICIIHRVAALGRRARARLDGRVYPAVLLVEQGHELAELERAQRATLEAVEGAAEGRTLLQILRARLRSQGWGQD